MEEENLKQIVWKLSMGVICLKIKLINGNPEAQFCWINLKLSL